MNDDTNTARSHSEISAPLGAQVLLVDSDPLSLARLERLLAPEVDLAATTSADLALEAIESGAQFDALICSLRRPDLQARSLQDQIARIDGALGRHILVLAGAAASLEEAVFFASGRVRVLFQPVSPSRLVQSVRRMIASASQRRLRLLDGPGFAANGFPTWDPRP